MKQLWAPWRMEYLTRDEKDRPKGCIFCLFPKEDADRENLILHRGKESFVILNRFPYNNGHLMVVPYAHVGEYGKLEASQALEMHELTQRVIEVLNSKYEPQGYNVGMNVGEAGGAGVRGHLHQHIVPRWNGDTNFMPILAEAKTMPQHLLHSFDMLKEAF